MTIFSFSTTAPPFGPTTFTTPLMAARVVVRSGSVLTAMRVFPADFPGAATGWMVTSRFAAASARAFVRSSAGRASSPLRRSGERRAREISLPSLFGSRGLMMTSAFSSTSTTSFGPKAIVAEASPKVLTASLS